MQQRKKALALVVLGMLVILLVWKQVRSTEPSYRGQPLSSWVLLNARPQGDGQFDPVVAIAEMGTNATPYLIKWMSQRPYNWQKRLRAYRNGNPTLHKIIPFWATGFDKENRALAALAAIQCLGPAGRSAIPSLEPLANNPTNYSVAFFATVALCKIGQEGIPAVIKVATNRQAIARLPAIDHLGKSRSVDAMPALIQCLKDPNHSISYAAECALGSITHQPIVGLPPSF